MSKEKTKFNDYATALAWIKKGRNRHERPVANNTRLISCKGLDGERWVALNLHYTDVIRLYENGDVDFSSGGWRTVTTANRIDYHPDFRLYTDKGSWYIYHLPSKEAAERRLREKFGLPQEWEAANDAFPYLSKHLGFIGGRKRGYGFWLEVAEVIGRKETVEIEREFKAQLATKDHLFFDGIRFSARGKRLNSKKVREVRAV